MENREPFIEFREFAGIDNVKARSRINYGTRFKFVRKATNCDIDNTRQITRRAGYSQVTSGAKHSLWSPPHRKYGLYMDSGSLIKLYEDQSTEIVDTGFIPGLPMYYVADGNDIYYSNGYVLKLLSEGVTVTSISDPDIDLKRAMRPGKFLEIYRSRLYAMQGNVLWYSDPISKHITDPRANFIQFKDAGTMVKAVDDGLYVSTTEAVYFLSGASPFEFELVKIFPYPALPGSALTMIDGRLGEDEVPGISVVWLSRKGYCLGKAGGEAQNLTIQRYQPISATSGASLERVNGSLSQIITVAHN